MSNNDYLMIEEVARKLGRMPSWVKEQICEGKIDATLSGNRWLISPQTFETLQSNSSTTGTSNTVHNFLPEKPPSKRNNASGRQSSQRRKSPELSHQSQRSYKSHESAAPSRKNGPKGRGKHPTLTQRIRKLDQKFDRVTTKLKTAISDSKMSTRSGPKSKQADNLLREWKEVKSELQHLLYRAHTKGLVLPTDLNIHRILGQKSGPVNQRSVQEDRRIRTKPPVVVKGIDGYYAGPRHAELQQATTRPAEVEAKLIILRNRGRAAAHDMQDPAKSNAAREAAGRKWAEARRQAEALERDLKNARTRDKSP